LRASLRGCRSVACGATLVCARPLFVSAEQRLPVARTPPGHELELSYQGGCRISERLPAHPFGPSFPRGSLAHSRAWLPYSRRAAPGGLRLGPQPLLITVQQNPLAAVLLRQVLNLSNSPGGRRITPDLILLAVPGARLSLTVLVTRPRCRLGSGLPTTPVDYGSTEPPGRRPPAPGPQHYRTSQAAPGLLRTSFSSRFPGLG
jgi:hypothetical protein